MLSTGLKLREMTWARKSLMWHSCQHRCSCIADSHFDNSAINLVNLQDQMMWMRQMAAIFHILTVVSIGPVTGYNCCHQ